MHDLKNRDSKRFVDIKKVDTKEFELPETVFVRDIDTRVFQGIVLQCLSRIEGVTSVEDSFISSILGRGGPEVGCGVISEKDSRNQSVSIKIEVNIEYGVPIPDKAEEIQSKVVEEITRLTGLRVSSIHVTFKNIITSEQAQEASREHVRRQAILDQAIEEEYSDRF